MSVYPPCQALLHDSSDSFISLSARAKSRTDEVMFIKFDFVTFYKNLFSFRLNNFKKYFLYRHFSKHINLRVSVLCKRNSYNASEQYASGGKISASPLSNIQQKYKPDGRT
jgi:hypothetical protein